MSWIGSLLSIGGTLLGSALQDDPESPQFAQAPQFPEANEARSKWWDYLQEIENDPNYGAVTPDWADIWQQAQQKVNQYYTGTAVAPGAIDTVKASAARRGVSDSPALQNNLTRMKVEQGSQLNEQATAQGVAKAQLAEKGRQTWLTSLQGLSSQRPESQMYTPQDQGDIGDLIYGLTPDIAALGSHALENIMKPKITSPYQSVGSYGGGGAGMRTGGWHTNMELPAMWRR